MTDETPVPWIAHYIYAGGSGETKTLIREILAVTYHDAYHHAAETAPDAKFILSVRPKSDEQIMGSVRYSVDRMKKSD